MPAKIVILTVHVRRLHEMCTTCWRSGMVEWHTTELRATGVVVGSDHTYCALCRLEAQSDSPR